MSYPKAPITSPESSHTSSGEMNSNLKRKFSELTWMVVSHTTAQFSSSIGSAFQFAVILGINFEVFENFFSFIIATSSGRFPTF